MLAFEGQYRALYAVCPYTRVLSVFRKADIDESALAAATVVITEEREAQLAARLLQFEETLTVVAREGTPHVMFLPVRSGGSVLRLLRAPPDPERRKRRDAQQPPEAGAADGENAEAGSGYPGYRNRRTDKQTRLSPGLFYNA